MTTVTVTIGATNVSAYVTRIERWRKIHNLGRIKIWLNNEAAAYYSAFAGDAVISVSVDGVSFFKGYLDLAIPKIKAKYIQSFEITGRCYGQDLANKFYDQIYNDNADDIIDDILAQSGSEITFGSPTTAPEIYFDCKAQYNIDSIREILELINYEGFVDLSKGFHMFPIGSLASGITMKMVKDDATNTIINVLEHTEKDCYEIRNYIIVKGDYVQDGYTEMNADGWLGLYTGNTCSDYKSIVDPIPQKGVAAIKITNGGAVSYTGCKLVLPKYAYTYVDFSKADAAEMSFQFYPYNAGASTLYWVSPGYFFVELVDDAGNVIKWLPNQNYRMNRWDSLTVPLGPQSTVNLDAISQGGKWFNTTGITFNWKVVEIRIDFGRCSLGAHAWALLDNLILPTHTMMTVADYTAGTTYKVRKLILPKVDSLCQKELEAYAVSIAEKHKDPVERLYLQCIGSAGLVGGFWCWWEGFTVTLNMPALTALHNRVFRFVEIHDVIEHEEGTVFEHVTDVWMVPQYTKLALQRWDYIKSGQMGIIRNLRNRLRYYEQKEVDTRGWYPGLPKPLWELYGQIPSDGMRFDTPRDNMIRNGYFEYDYNNDGIPDDWARQTNGDLATIALSADAQDGANSLKFTAPDNTTWDGVIQDIPIQAGRKYVLIGMYKADSGQPCVEVWHQILDRTKTSVLSDTGLFDKAVAPTTWTAFSTTITVAATYGGTVPAYLRLRIGYKQTTGTATLLYFDALTLWKEISDDIRIMDLAIRAAKLKSTVGTRGEYRALPLPSSYPEWTTTDYNWVLLYSESLAANGYGLTLYQMSAEIKALDPFAVYLKMTCQASGGSEEILYEGYTFSLVYLKKTSGVSTVVPLGETVTLRWYGRKASVLDVGSIMYMQKPIYTAVTKNYREEF